MKPMGKMQYTGKIYRYMTDMMVVLYLFIDISPPNELPKILNRHTYKNTQMGRV